MHLLIYTIPSEPDKKVVIVEDENSLAVEIERLLASGKEAKVDLYEANKVSYKIRYEEKQQTIIHKEPKIDIVR